MSIVDWLSILVGISSGALAGGISYGLLRGEVRALRYETDSQRALLKECRDRIFQLMAEGHQPGQAPARNFNP